MLTPFYWPTGILFKTFDIYDYCNLSRTFLYNLRNGREAGMPSAILKDSQAYKVNEETAKNFLQKAKEVYTWLLTLKQ
jgi:hypothetical protein